MKIAIYGISGSGKTFLCKHLEQSIKGAVFYEGSEHILKLNNITTNEFKRFDSDKKNEIRLDFIDYLKEKSKSVPVMIVDGHFSFINKSGFNIVFTDSDKDFYDFFFYIDLPAEIIKERHMNDKSKKRKCSLVDIIRWIEFEKRELMTIIPEDKLYFINEADIFKSTDYIKKTILKQKNINNMKNELMKIVKASNKDTYILFDADNTLFNGDSGKIFLKHMGIDFIRLKEIFESYGDYCFEAFYNVGNFYSEISDDDFIKASHEISESIKIDERFMELINEFIGNTEIIIITAGFKILWKDIIKKSGFDIKLIAGNNTSLDNYIVDNTLKGEVVDFLKNKDKKVISFGDSFVDKEMLLKSDKSYLVAYKKIRYDLDKILYQNNKSEMIFMNEIENRGIKLKNIDFKHVLDNIRSYL